MSRRAVSLGTYPGMLAEVTSNEDETAKIAMSMVGTWNIKNVNSGKCAQQFTTTHVERLKAHRNNTARIATFMAGTWNITSMDKLTF